MAQAAIPSFSPSTGSFASGPVVVTITSATSGSTIYYTEDGTVPTYDSSSIANGGTVSLSASATLNAIAAHAGDTDSDVTTGTFVIAPEIVQRSIVGGQSLTPMIDSPRTSVAGTNLGTEIL